MRFALAVILVGRFVVAPLISKRRKQEDAPRRFTTSKRDKIHRPDGSIINVEHYGKPDAQPIIFIHGLSSSSSNWYYQRNFFGNKYRLIMMDLAGMGKSTRPKNHDFSIAKHANDLGSVIEHCKIQHPILWGHSLGGMTILTFLSNNENSVSVKGAILQNTTYENPLHTIIFRSALSAAQKPILTPLSYIVIFLSPVVWVLRWVLYMSGFTHLMTRFFMFAGSQTARQLDFIARLSTSTSPAVMARASLGMFNYDVSKKLPEITVPCLVMASDKDRLTQKDASTYMRDKIPNAKLVRIQGANHQSLIEKHEEVNAAANNFIEALH